MRLIGNGYQTNGTGNANWTWYVPEEGKELKLVSKKNVQVWNCITQNKASELSRNMYSETTFESDLVNSYAWETAIIFIQTFSGCVDYAYKNFSTNPENTGINPDKYCNVHDMSGNLREWTTETRNDQFNFITRGGVNYGEPDWAVSCSVGRDGWVIDSAWSDVTFRPILYVAQ